MKRVPETSSTAPMVLLIQPYFHKIRIEQPQGQLPTFKVRYIWRPLDI